MKLHHDEYFKSLRGKKILVMGLGVSNRPLVRMLLSYGCDVTGCDKTPREQFDEELIELERLGCKMKVGEGYLEGLSADLVFRTPGMHPNIPALKALRDGGAEVTSEMEVFFELCPCTMIAVTGSDGKTTTTTLISEMLKASGKTVWLGGNIGTPLLPLIDKIKETDYAVVELSSFQLMDMHESAHIAVVTNLAPNHLDVHKDMDEYIQAKVNLFRYQGQEDILIVNADNAITAEFAGNGVTRYFSYSAKVKTGTYLEDGFICRGGKKVLDKKEIVIPGEHNVENYMTAIMAVEGLVEDEVIRQVARTFGGVEHRIEFVREVNGVRYYNDSIASSPTRTIAGMKSFPEKVILIAGGYDKKIPYDVLGPHIVEHTKAVYLCGATAPKIRQAVENAPGYAAGFPELIDCKDLEDATRKAAQDAEKGDVVLMSPASASFDQFKNFEVRGRFFKNLVKEL